MVKAAFDKCSRELGTIAEAAVSRQLAFHAEHHGRLEPDKRDERWEDRDDNDAVTGRK